MQVPMAISAVHDEELGVAMLSVRTPSSPEVPLALCRRYLCAEVPSNLPGLSVL